MCPGQHTSVNAYAGTHSYAVDVRTEYVASFKTTRLTRYHHWFNACGVFIFINHFALQRRPVSVRLVATSPIARGTEILISYGDSLSNDDLLLDYGFVQRGNPNDRCPVGFSVGLVEMARNAAGVERT